MQRRGLLWCFVCLYVCLFVFVVVIIVLGFFVVCSFLGGLGFFLTLFSPLFVVMQWRI